MILLVVDALRAINQLKAESFASGGDLIASINGLFLNLLTSLDRCC